MYWITKKNERILIRHMEDSHLLNVYHFLQRNDFVSSEEFSKILNDRVRNFPISKKDYGITTTRPISYLINRIKLELRRRNLI